MIIYYPYKVISLDMRGESISEKSWTVWRRRRGCGEARSSISADFFVFYGGFPVSAGGGDSRFFPGSGRKVEVALLLRNKFLQPSLHFVVSCSGTGDGFVRLGASDLGSMWMLLFWLPPGLGSSAGPRW